MIGRTWRLLVAMSWILCVALVGGCAGCEDDTGGGISDDGGWIDDADTPDVEQPDVEQPDVDAASDAESDAEQCSQGTVCGDECCTGDQECIDGACLDSCEGTRCGEQSELCCTDEEVCIFDGCHQPGDDCSSYFQCPEDEYCEETLGSCLPREAADDSCTYQPEPGEFNPADPGHFDGLEHDGRTFDKSFTTPAVADVDDDDIPEIVALLYSGDGSEDALLAIIDGEDQSLLAYGGVGRVQWNSAGLATAQLDDGTPELEIVAHQRGGGLVAFRYDADEQELSEWWSNDEGALGSIDQESAPGIADLDEDGSPEVYLGFSVVDSNGDIWNGLNEGSAGGQGGRVASTAVDMDGEVDDDGNRNLELVAGNRVMKTDGSMLWDRSDDIGDGFPAVGDVTGDGEPEVVTTTDGQVYVLDGDDGSVVFGPTDIPGGGEGGPPTIADFDGDDNIEFAAAGEGRYTVYDPDCTDDPDPDLCDSEREDGILWSNEVQDLSSSRTGSSVFDFEGDGRAEVVYNDECFLRVYDGVDGTVLFEEANTTRTGSEYPIIVDVDADFNAEIVVVSNNDQIDRDGCEDNYDNYPGGGTTGVFAYSDSDNNWVPTRQLWNQHPYHITNVFDDATIPAQQPVHYESEITNSFRLNVQPDGLFNAPDLVVDQVALGQKRCGDKPSADIDVTVKNDGSQGVGPGVEVEVAVDVGDGPEVIGTVETTGRILPGQTETVTLEWEPREDDLDGSVDVMAEVDAAEEFNECVEDNNSTSVELDEDDLAFGGLIIDNFSVESGSCGVNGSVTVSFEVVNDGDETVDADVPVKIVADRGGSSETIDEVRTSSDLDPGQGEQFDVDWSAGDGFFGHEFTVRAEIDPDGEADACATGEGAEEDVDCEAEG
ncbi:MAG: CARDB domain-containing protein [Persicimonas sp.]